METNTQDVDQLAPYAASARATLLVWPIIGVLAAGFLASFHYDSAALKAAAMILYVLGVFGVVAWQVRKSGVQPSFGAMPPELKRNLYTFWVATAVLMAVAVPLGVVTNFLVVGLLVGLVFTIVGLTYHLRSRSIIGNLLAAS